jgi:hypothetical protein
VAVNGRGHTTGTPSVAEESRCPVVVATGTARVWAVLVTLTWTGTSPDVTACPICCPWIGWRVTTNSPHPAGVFPSNAGRRAEASRDVASALGSTTADP